MQHQIRALLVLQYIWKHSDEEHQLTAKDIAKNVSYVKGSKYRYLIDVN